MTNQSRRTLIVNEYGKRKAERFRARFGLSTFMAHSARMATCMITCIRSSARRYRWMMKSEYWHSSLLLNAAKCRCRADWTLRHDEPTG